MGEMLTHLSNVFQRIGGPVAIAQPVQAGGGVGKASHCSRSLVRSFLRSEVRQMSQNVILSISVSNYLTFDAIGCILDAGCSEKESLRWEWIKLA